MFLCPLLLDAAFLLTVGSFLLTVELLTIGALLLTILAFLLTIEAFLLTIEKCVQTSYLTDCKQRSSTVSTKAPTASKSSLPFAFAVFPLRQVGKALSPR